MSPTRAAAPIEVIVIGGYLGAGKTTLVNHLLADAGHSRFAVLVNDFGKLSIDARLIESRTASVISLAGGCVCCSFGSDMISALQDLAHAEPPPLTILIETSGVALPRAVLDSAGLVDGLAPSGVVVVADGHAVIAQGEDRFVGDTVRRQVAEADLLLLNKTDVVSRSECANAERWIHALNPSATVVTTERSRISVSRIASLLARRADASRSPRADADVEGGVGAVDTHVGVDTRVNASDVFASESFLLHGRYQVERLATALLAPEAGVLRAKGVLLGADGRSHTIQVAGGRCEVAPEGHDRREVRMLREGREGGEGREAWLGSSAVRGRDHARSRAGGELVCIGRAGIIDRDVLMRIVSSSKVSASRAR